MSGGNDDINLAQLHADLRRDEGERLYAYQDSEGYWTIGVGVLIDRRRGGGITREESAYLLGNRVRAVIDELDRALPWWRSMSEARQRALANMAFNLGVTTLLTFKRTLESMRGGDYERAASEMLESKWAKQVGARAERLAALVRAG